jgi:hypothetical protein
MTYLQALSHLMGLLREPVMVFIAQGGTSRNAAMLQGTLVRGADVKLRGHHEGREGSTFFCVYDERTLINGFFLAEDDFETAAETDDDPPGIQILRTDGISITVVPIPPDSSLLE